MEIQKYSDFLLNEAKVSKSDVVSDLLDMLKKKPSVSMDSMSTEKGIYSLSGMKKYFADKYTGTIVGNALGDLQNDKNVDIKSIRVKVSVWKELVPYWYIGLTDTQVKKLKEDYEKEESNKNKKEVVKKEASKKTAVTKRAVKKAAKKITTEENKTEAPERAPGSAPKKRATKKK